MNILAMRSKKRKCSNTPGFFQRMWCYPVTAIYKVKQTGRLYNYWSKKGGDLFWKASILLSMFAIFVTVIAVFLCCCLCRACRVCCWRDGYGTYDDRCFGTDDCATCGFFESCRYNTCCEVLCCCFHRCLYGEDGLPSVKFDPRADRMGR